MSSLVYLLVWSPPPHTPYIYITLTPNKVRNMAEFQPLSGELVIVSGPGLMLNPGQAVVWSVTLTVIWGTCGVFLPPTFSY